MDDSKVVVVAERGVLIGLQERHEEVFLDCAVMTRMSLDTPDAEHAEVVQERIYELQLKLLTQE